MKKSELDPNPTVPIPVMAVVCDKCRAEGMAGDAMFSAIPEILNFEPVPRRAAVNSWSAEHQRAFIAALAITGSAKKAAATIGRHTFGADQLRKARGGKSFSDAWDAALEVARERELARVYENLAELQADDEAANARGSGSHDHFEESDPEVSENEYRECQARIREKLLRARRLLLAEISGDPAKRAAWEVLTGPVDWEKAENLQPQDNEPHEFPNMRRPDMLLTAEAGYMGELTGSRDRKQELLEAVNGYAATGGVNDDLSMKFE